MKISLVKDKIHPNLFKKLGFETFRPAQSKAINSGLLEGKNLLICTPTASGKTLVAEIAMLQNIYNNKGKGVYIVPLKALASEKYEYFKEKYPDLKVALSIGDTDSSDSYLDKFDIIITVSEKLDSLIRHKSAFLRYVATVVVDEVHLLNDPYRGPTVEIVITILRQVLKKAQFIALSATIGNPKELAEWLDANLVIDDWRPVKLHQGIYQEGEIEFY
ncbi:DEAD/DEAH box helicase [archaeon]|jgi:helicase|nr:DEAD/DEAH box helicase [archaeon]MBT4022492.1 DEAD/DEAH box helicase [archaeon]MBT4272331.1 DEAD/DEAH box helicase [archaeon]MBT4460440.1 DEAD/DEAH box helicase [archaeon]MBT4858459.1 DEAD/DEAH box helicase [archaeon]